jgi:hypothetical protein
MPLAVLWILGAVGALAAAKLIAREARRINAELHSASGHSFSGSQERERVVRLRRDPSTGVYRPD